MCRTANQGGATDSSQMSGLMWQPLSPEKPVKENIFVETEAEEEVGATPFFSSHTGIVFIKGGNVVNFDEMTVADILVEDGKITAVGEDLDIPEGSTVINAVDKFVFPGGIDTNTHLYQGVDKTVTVKDDFESVTIEKLWLVEQLWWWIWSFLRKEEAWWMLLLSGRKLESKRLVVTLL